MPRPIAKNCKGIIATKRTKQDSLAGILVQECEPCAACTNNNNELQCSCSWSELLEPTDLSAYTRLDEFKDQPEKKKRKLSKIASAVLSHSIIRNTTNSAITKESSTSTNVECIPADSNIILDSDTGNGWAPFSLALPLLKALDTLGFAAPTPIQLQTLPVALKAQNGSGKTLAYGLPILQILAQQPLSLVETSRGLTALILAPTRELAMQVSSHLTQASANLDACKIITIVGGLSQHKQLRLARSSPDIIVATPGRLWELMELDDELKAIVKAVKVLVIDEADRMLEKGHFRDLEFILAVLRGPRPSETKKELATDSETVPIIRQTLVFSATMLQDPEMAHDRKSKKKQHKSNSSVFGTLD